MSVETITWHPAAKPPDADLTVLVHVPTADEPVWPGYWNGIEWTYADGVPVRETVKEWADLPQGSK